MSIPAIYFRFLFLIKTTNGREEREQRKLEKGIKKYVIWR